MIGDRFIKINARAERGPHNKAPRLCVGAGRAHELLYAESQRQLALARRECGFSYVRFHGLLHDDMGVFRLDRSGRPVHDWQYVDLVFDFILSIGMRPFVEIGFTPPELASGPETIFWWRGNVSLPKSREWWLGLIDGLLRHWTERYGPGELSKWYFEIWNEPNLSGFFAASQGDYFTLYADTARAIKAVNPAYRVGGPATAGCEWIEAFIAHCHGNGLPLDFISTHTYGVDGYLDEFGVQKTKLVPESDSIVKDVRMVARQVAESPVPGLPLHFTEWSTSYSPRDPVHDSYHSAAWILSKLKRCEGLTESMSYWTFSDIFEEPGPPQGNFHGGFGLMNTQGLRKPSYFAYKYFNALGPRELSCQDEDAWVCASDEGFQALVWDWGPSETLECNQEYYVKDLPAKAIGRVELEIGDCPPGSYRVTERRIGYRYNDAYSAYLGLGKGELSREGEASLRRSVADEPARVADLNVGQGGSLSYSTDMRENGVIFLDIVFMG